MLLNTQQGLHTTSKKYHPFPGWDNHRGAKDTTMTTERIQKIINEITDIVCDLECDNQEYFQMYQNYEISPEEYEEKTDEISEKLEALDKAYDALKALL